jgi:hypothetical protein
VTQTERLEYCDVGKGLGIVRRRLWLGKESNTENSRKVTPTLFFISHHTEKGKGNKEILSIVQQKKEFHLRLEYVLNP